MKELQEKHGSVPRSWGFWLRIKRAQVSLWWNLPCILSSPRYFDIESKEREQIDRVESEGNTYPETYGVPTEGSAILREHPVMLETSEIGKYPTVLTPAELASLSGRDL